MSRYLWMFVIACSGVSPAKVEPPAPPIVADAAIDAAVPDAGISAALAAAPAWVFRYATAQRTETWTLRVDAGQALLVVESATGTLRYTGTATEAPDALALAVTTGTAKLALQCKHAKRALSAKCNDTKAARIDVLDCYHPDFKEPMPFGHAPGIEYAVDASCNGYRVIAP
ncbi:MAG TPA: hypothetical protein VFQ65_04220 [Kofleriaceae bacterium]|nr:hypothetical protein [Kofleriaceae bacterium]